MGSSSGMLSSGHGLSLGWASIYLHVSFVLQLEGCREMGPALVSLGSKDAC